MSIFRPEARNERGETGQEGEGDDERHEPPGRDGAHGRFAHPRAIRAPSTIGKVTMANGALPTTKAAALARVQALIAGTQKHFPSGQFTLGNTVYTTASLVQLLQGLAAAMTAVNTAEASVKDALKALQGLSAIDTPVIQVYVRYVRAAFDSAAQTLADFGLEPPKARTPLTAEQKAAAVAKLRATRKARGTTSKKQKLAVTGNVTGVVVTPVTAPAAEPPAQPVSQTTSAPSAPKS
jgi:hypothetical protein